jgi:hypothetical protein
MDPTESDERYQVVIKHYLKDVLHMASFKTLDQAHAYLRACWAKLPVDRDMIDIQCGAAIYDNHNCRKRVLVLGADYLTNENPNKRA